MKIKSKQGLMKRTGPAEKRETSEGAGEIKNKLNYDKVTNSTYEPNIFYTNLRLAPTLT